MVEIGDLDERVLGEYYKIVRDEDNEAVRHHTRQAVLTAAYRTFLREAGRSELETFRQWRLQEGQWLRDHATFTVICREKGSKDWQSWEPNLRDRDPTTMSKILRSEPSRVEMYTQWRLSQQAANLKLRAYQANVKLFDDKPFYIGHGSSDVWAHREQFQLDEDGRPIFVAGAPPDQFSGEPQVWGMPLYR